MHLIIFMNGEFATKRLKRSRRISVSLSEFQSRTDLKAKGCVFHITTELAEPQWMAEMKHVDICWDCVFGEVGWYSRVGWLQFCSEAKALRDKEEVMRWHLSVLDRFSFEPLEMRPMCLGCLPFHVLSQALWECEISQHVHQKHTWYFWLGHALLGLLWWQLHQQQQHGQLEVQGASELMNGKCSKTHKNLRFHLGNFRDMGVYDHKASRFRRFSLYKHPNGTLQRDRLKSPTSIKHSLRSAYIWHGQGSWRVSLPVAKPELRLRSLLFDAQTDSPTVQQSNGLTFHLYPVSTGRNLHLREPLPNGIAITWFFPQKTSPRTLPKEIHNPIACCLKDLRPVGLNEIVKIVFGESLKKGICKNKCWEIRMP